MTIESPGAFWKDYELIDSGNFEKLERFGPFIMARPEPKALWDKSLSDGEWNKMIHTRFKTGAGFGKAGKEDSGTWARGNMEASRLDNIRWIVEDALKFARREAKRGNTYQGIILDPPAYGHGPDGEKWKLDECLNEMLQCVAAILAPQDSFMVLNLYSNGYSAVLGETIVKQAFCIKNAYKSLDFGELVLRDSYGKNLPLSVFVRLAR